MWRPSPALCAHLGFSASWIWATFGRAAFPPPDPFKAVAPFPEVEEQYLIEDNFNYPVSFNGKMKYTLELPMNLSIQQIEEQVMANADVISHLQGAVPKKIIIVPKKIVNIVV